LSHAWYDEFDAVCSANAVVSSVVF